MKLDWPEITALTLVVLAAGSGARPWVVVSVAACAVVTIAYPVVARKVRARHG